MDLIDIQKNLLETSSKLEDAGVKAFESRAEYNHMKELKKIILSQIISDISMAYKNKSEKIPSVNKLEIIAQANKQYSDHLKAINILEKTYGKNYAIYEALKAKFECYRSMLSLQKSLSKTL